MHRKPKDVSRPDEEPVLGHVNDGLFVEKDYVWSQSAWHRGIPTDEITSVEVQHESEDRLIFFALLVGVAGLAFVNRAQFQGLGVAGLIAAAILAAIWYGTRKATLTIASPTAEIEVVLEGAEHDHVYDIVREIRSLMSTDGEQTVEVAQEPPEA